MPATPSSEYYGNNFPPGLDQATVELLCFRDDLSLGRTQHCRNAIDRIWNDFQKGSFYWNDWSERLLQGFCNEKWVTITGPGASSKTTTAAIYALTRFYASPHNTAIICTSTTLDGLRRRIWGEISKFYRLRPACGNPIQSRNCIQYEKGVDAAGLYGIATDKGEVEKAIGKIIGFHRVPNLIIIVDEMPYTPESIVEACVNLESGKSFFQFIGLGNADDHLDPHGRMSEPLKGWDTINEEMDEWETRRGRCIHLDGLKSPNIVEGPLPNGKPRYPGILTQENIQSTIDIYGQDSPQFWQMRRGFWSPEGVQKTVLSMPMIVKGRAKERVNFDSGWVWGAGLDPAFEGGDRCVLRFAKLGVAEGRQTVQLDDIIFIKTKSSPDDPTHYQIFRQVREECVKRGVAPSMFALDATGEGGGLHAIFQREWSPEVLGIEFGGRPSKNPVSQTNPKRADQEYDRRVTELWFYFRLLVQNEQIRALDEETATEFCRRWWEMKGPYISVETKGKMKERTRKSPDLADNAVIITEMFRQRGGLRLQKVDFESLGIESRWDKFQKARSLTPDYATPNLN